MYRQSVRVSTNPRHLVLRGIAPFGGALRISDSQHRSCRRYQNISGSHLQQQQQQQQQQQLQQPQQQQREHQRVRPSLLAPSGLLVAAVAWANTDTTSERRFYHGSSLMQSAKTPTLMEGNSIDDDAKPKTGQDTSTDDSAGSNESFDIRDLWKKDGSSSTDNSSSSFDPKEFWNKIISSSNDGSTKKDSTKGSGEKPASEPSKGESKQGLLSAVINFVTGGQDNNNNESSTNDAKRSGTSSDFASISKNFLKLVTGSSASNSDNENNKNSIAEIVAKVRGSSEQGDVEESASLIEIFELLNKYKDSLGNVADKFVGDVDFSRLTPTALMYYLEHEDEVKNPSWKRRMHTFCSGIDVTEMKALNDALSLAKLSYADTVDEVRDALDKLPTPYELVYCNLKSEPGRPAHFLAVQRDQPEASYFFNTDGLQVILVVRGTKSAADAVTDLMCDTEDYQGGKAHSFILGSGRFIANKHRELLHELCESSGKPMVELNIIGHSLGAGSGAIAAMEFNALNDPRISAKMVGFGCPALLSKDLAEKSDFITTVINDSDVVPRLSGIAVSNLLRNVLEFDWLPYAKRDIQFALAELQKQQPLLFNESTINKITAAVEPLLESVRRETRVEEKKELLQVELFPPGKCVHFYRDGVGFSGCHVPNTFCSEIDVSRRMIDDHLLPSGYQQTLLEVERQRTGDHNFRFDQDQNNS